VFLYGEWSPAMFLRDTAVRALVVEGINRCGGCGKINFDHRIRGTTWGNIRMIPRKFGTIVSWLSGLLDFTGAVQFPRAAPTVDIAVQFTVARARTQRPRRRGGHCTTDVTTRSVSRKEPGSWRERSPLWGRRAPRVQAVYNLYRPPRGRQSSRRGPRGNGKVLL